MSVKQRPLRDTVTIGQFWMHKKRGNKIWISQVYRHEHRVIAVFFDCFGSQTGKEYVSFADLKKNWNLMGPVPHAA